MASRTDADLVESSRYEIGAACGDGGYLHVYVDLQTTIIYLTSTRPPVGKGKRRRKRRAGINVWFKTCGCRASMEVKGEKKAWVR